MSAMNFWVARARRREMGSGVEEGLRPARVRKYSVTASGICVGLMLGFHWWKWNDPCEELR